MLILSIILIANIKFSVTTIISVRNDQSDWPTGSVRYFNSLYSVTINEEHLNNKKLCSGNCDLLDKMKKNFSNYLSYPNECHGSIQHCLLHKKNEKRQQALDDYLSVLHNIRNYRLTRGLKKLMNKAYYKYTHTGNICKCLCERTYNPKEPTPRGTLLDSICFDPVSVDSGYVATGVRFNIHDNRVHLELQQGILINGTIKLQTVDWKISRVCKNIKKVIYNFKKGSYTGLKIILEDLILSNDFVLTGITFGKSVYGRLIDHHGNINFNVTAAKSSQCKYSTQDLVHVSEALVASTSVIGKNPIRSKSCQHHVLFGGTSEKFDNIQHVVPYVDLLQVETDPPEPISGIGWYYRGIPEYGGFLSLQIFKYK